MLLGNKKNVTIVMQAKALNEVEKNRMQKQNKK